MLDYTAWKDIGAPDYVINWVTYGVPILVKTDPGQFELSNAKLGGEKQKFVCEELQRLLKVNAIEVCTFKPQCISPINVVPKRNNGHRLVIDLRLLNKFCDSPRFTNEDIRTVKQLIHKDDHLRTIDLKDGFLHVPIDPAYRDLLGFKWKGVFYRFKKLPFGLCLSPFYFAKIIRPIIQYLRSNGVRIVAFVDDFLLMTDLKSSTDHCDLLIHTLSDLGWSINFEKSSLTPKTNVIYLGHKITSNGPSGYPEIAITSERIRKLKRSIRAALLRDNITARRLASITGQCVAMAQVILPAKLLLRAAYRLLRQRHSWDSTLQITADVVKELEWWLQYVTEWNMCPVIVRPVELQLTTDASHIGWGATLGELKASGQWNRRLSRQSSNHREMMAVLLALLTFQTNIKDKSVQIFTDNTTTLAYIANKGGPKKDLTEIACAIWKLCITLNTHIQISHIRGLENIESDRLSREIDNYNWMLHPNLFKMIDILYGPHTVDRFASGVNSQLSRFNSRYWEPFTEGIDALSQQNWCTEMNYVNAPFRLLPRILEVIQAQKAEATVIAPWWPGQPWFHRLREMTITPPLKLPNNKRAFKYMGAKPEPLKNIRWKIYAWRVSGKLG